VQNQKAKDRFKKLQASNGYKLVSLYPPEIKDSHDLLRQKLNQCEQTMRAHEAVCTGRPSNKDMKIFFNLVWQSITLTNDVLEEDYEPETIDNEETVLAAEMMAKFDLYSSDDDDESRVTNNSDKLRKQKEKRFSKSAKKTTQFEGTDIADLTIDKVIKKSKYAVLVRYENENHEEEEFNEDEFGEGSKRTCGTEQGRDEQDSFKWIIVEVVDILEEEKHVRAKVYKMLGLNWYPCLDDSKKGKKKQTTLVEKFAVESFLCLVNFGSTHPHRPDKRSAAMITACMQRYNYNDDVDDFQEFEVTAILDHRIAASGNFIEYEVEWGGSGETTWEPLTSLTNAHEQLRLYEATNLDSKILENGSRIMIAATAALLSNHHQIEFFHFQGSRLARSNNYFGIEDMNRLTTTSDGEHRWLNSTIISWHSQLTSAGQDRSWVVFSPYAVTKFMQSVSDKLQGGFVDDCYTSSTCRHWFIPVSWQGNNIPRYCLYFIYEVDEFACRDWTKGGHWTLLIMTSCSNDSPPVFIHIDPLPSKERESDLMVLVEEIKDHLVLMSFKNCANRDSLLKSSRILHSSHVNSPKQKGCWECGYYVLHMINMLSENNCAILDTMDRDNEVVNLHGLFVHFEASEMRRGLAIQAVTQTTNQRTQWIDPAASRDSTSWLPCTILDSIDLGSVGSGVWYRINFRIGNNFVSLWCQLPDNNCLYWKHTN
jgi:hypothetical protein